MKKIISHWSIKGGLENSRPIEEVMDAAKNAGFDGVELAVGETGELNVTTDQATCEKYRDLAKKKGVVLETVATGVTWGCSPTNPDPAIRKRSLELHAAALQRAAWLGAKAMLYVPGAVTIQWDRAYGPVPYEKAFAWAKEGIAALAKTAEKIGVDLCVENVWNGLFYSPLEFAQVIDDAKSPRVGAYFDCGNVLGYHQHPPHWINILGKRIKRVHIKDYKRDVGGMAGFCDLLDGDMPWKETMAALRAIGYDGTVVAEMIPWKEGLLANTKKAMDKIWAMGAESKKA